MFERSGSTDIKGMIKCPCCQQEKVAAYDDSHGHASIKCPKCGRFGVYDFDNMTAVIGKAARGAAKKFNREKTEYRY